MTRPMTVPETAGIHNKPQVAAPSQRRVGDASSRVRPLSDRALITFILMHAPLAILLRSFPILATMHALAAFAIGLWAVLARPKEDLLHLWAAAYIVGGEVLWRLTASDHLPHEFGKYAVTIILSIAILHRYRRRPLPVLPLLYVLCLLPALLFLVNNDFSIELAQARRQVFGIAGPLSLGLCALYFSSLKLNREVLERLAFIVIGPSVGMAALVAYNVITLGDDLRFGYSSNPLTSGGGPNQVSNTLALGATFCWLVLSRLRVGRLERLVLIVILFGLTIAALLTFSRGGVYTVGLVVLCTLPFILRNNPKRGQLVLTLILAAMAAVYFVWPWFNEFTSGFGAERFSSLDSSSRWELVQDQIQVWLHNPVFGVGLDMTGLEVADYLKFDLHTHTEYTRLLAEHGLFGLLALAILVIGAVKNYRRARYWEARVWVTAATIYAFSYMTQAATRTVTPGFVYGLGWATLFPQMSNDGTGQLPSDPGR